MRTGRFVRRALRRGLATGWAGVRPGGLTDLRRATIDEAPRDGTPPRHDQVWLPRTEPTGPWAEVDPLVAQPWLGWGGALAGLALSAVIGLRVRRGVHELFPPDGAGQAGDGS